MIGLLAVYFLLLAFLGVKVVVYFTMPLGMLIIYALTRNFRLVLFAALILLLTEFFNLVPIHLIIPIRVAPGIQLMSTDIIVIGVLITGLLDRKMRFYTPFAILILMFFVAMMLSMLYSLLIDKISLFSSGGGTDMILRLVPTYLLYFCFI